MSCVHEAAGQQERQQRCRAAGPVVAVGAAGVGEGGVGVRAALGVERPAAGGPDVEDFGCGLPADGFLVYLEPQLDGEFADERRTRLGVGK